MKLQKVQKKFFKLTLHNKIYSYLNFEKLRYSIYHCWINKFFLMKLKNVPTSFPKSNYICTTKIGLHLLKPIQIAIEILMQILSFQAVYVVIKFNKCVPIHCYKKERKKRKF